MKHKQTIEINGLSPRTPMEWEDGFLWFSRPAHMQRMLADFQLYQTMTALPGDIIDMGVFKGSSFFRWATFRNYLEGDSARKLVGFDVFGKFPTKGISIGIDLEFIKAFQEKFGDGLTKQQAEQLIALKGFENIELVEGDIVETLPHYVQSNPAARIALVHLEMRVKEPTSFAIDAIFDRIVPGGLIVIEDYMVATGTTEAIDDLVAQRGLTVERTEHGVGAVYIRKPF
jgi:hypothetical protein